MEQLIGTISKDGETVAEDVDVHFEVLQQGKLRECRGFISTQLGWQMLQPNTIYWLTARDGRAGEILFTHVPFGNGTRQRIEITFLKGFE
jgi:hypothetical protein